MEDFGVAQDVVEVPYRRAEDRVVPVEGWSPPTQASGAPAVRARRP
ncbi:hypothetical protein ACIPPS_05755 [Streptomyces sp. NPDC090127]